MLKVWSSAGLHAGRGGYCGSSPYNVHGGGQCISVRSIRVVVVGDGGGGGGGNQPLVRQVSVRMIG